MTILSIRFGVSCGYELAGGPGYIGSGFSPCDVEEALLSYTGETEGGGANCGGGGG